MAATFVRDPDGALRDAGLPNVSAAQLQAVAASAAPAGVFLGDGDPVYGLQNAVANYHSIPAAFSPQTAFAPQTDFASHNATELASNNDFMSPNQSAGTNAQNGAFNLGFGDITLGDKTTNTATNGGVVNTGHAGHIDTTSVNGDGNVVGHDNNANTGVIESGSHSPITVGEGNQTHVSDTSQHSGGDIIDGNQGTVIKDNDMSGGHGGQRQLVRWWRPAWHRQRWQRGQCRCRRRRWLDHRDRQGQSLEHLDHGRRRKPDHRRPRPRQRQHLDRRLVDPHRVNGARGQHLRAGQLHPHRQLGPQ